MKKLLTLTLTIILGLGALAFYDDIFAKPKDIVVKEERKQDDNLEEIKTLLMEKITNYNLYTFAEDENLNILSLNNDMTESQIKALYFYFLNNEIEITKENVDKYFNELYGTNAFSYKDIIFDDLEVPIAEYNQKQNNYKMTDASYDLYLNKPIKIKNNNIDRVGNNYVLTVSFLYSNEEGYYLDPSYKSKIEQLNDTSQEYAIEYFDNNFDQLKNNKPQFKYTFEKKDEEYHLKIIEIIK